MARPRVLFICDHNSARSQMAEALLKAMAGERSEAASAGFEPGELNPLAVAAMSELGIDISGNATKRVFSFYRAGALFDYFITVCDEASQENAPFSLDTRNGFTGALKTHRDFRALKTKSSVKQEESEI